MKTDYYQEFVATRDAIQVMAEQMETVLADMRDMQLANPAEIDPRWISIATTHFQQGFTALRSAIYNRGGKL